MPLYDIKSTDREFQPIQRVTASGILKVKGESYQWANRTWFYPDTTLTVKEFSEGLNAFDSKSVISEDQTIITVQKASYQLSAFLNRDASTEIRDLWNKRMQRRYDPHLQITKRELSTLVDELVRPFETRSIGFDGNYR
jgi:hypothetical protein